MTTFTGGAEFSATIRQHTLIADQPSPTGNNRGPTPTEFFLFGLAACTAHYVVEACKRSNIDPAGVTVRLEAERTSQPSRIGKITLQCRVPSPLTDDQRKRIQRAAEQCQVHNSITHTPEIVVQLVEPASQSAAKRPASRPTKSKSKSKSKPSSS